MTPPVLAILHGPSASGKSHWLGALSPWLSPIELDDVGYCSCTRCGGVVAGRCRWDGWLARTRAILARRRAVRVHPQLRARLTDPGNRNTVMCRDWLLGRLEPPDGTTRRGWVASKGYLNLGDAPFFEALEEGLGVRVVHVLLMPPEETHRAWVERRRLGGLAAEVLATRGDFDPGDYQLVLTGDEQPEVVARSLTGR